MNNMSKGKNAYGKELDAKIAEKKKAKRAFERQLVARDAIQKALDARIARDAKHARLVEVFEETEITSYVNHKDVKKVDEAYDLVKTQKNAVKLIIPQVYMVKTAGGTFEVRSGFYSSIGLSMVTRELPRAEEVRTVMLKPKEMDSFSSDFKCHERLTVQAGKGCTYEIVEGLYQVLPDVYDEMTYNRIDTDPALLKQLNEQAICVSPDGSIFIKNEANKDRAGDPLVMFGASNSAARAMQYIAVPRSMHADMTKIYDYATNYSISAFNIYTALTGKKFEGIQKNFKRNGLMLSPTADGVAVGAMLVVHGNLDHESVLTGKGKGRIAEGGVKENLELTDGQGYARASWLKENFNSGNITVQCRFDTFNGKGMLKGLKEKAFNKLAKAIMSKYNCTIHGEGEVNVIIDLNIIKHELFKFILMKMKYDGVVCPDDRADFIDECFNMDAVKMYVCDVAHSKGEVATSPGMLKKVSVEFSDVVREKADQSAKNICTKYLSGTSNDELGGFDKFLTIMNSDELLGKNSNLMFTSALSNLNKTKEKKVNRLKADLDGCYNKILFDFADAFGVNDLLTARSVTIDGETKRVYEAWSVDHILENQEEILRLESIMSEYAHKPKSRKYLEAKEALDRLMTHAVIKFPTQSADEYVFARFLTFKELKGKISAVTDDIYLRFMILESYASAIGVVILTADDHIKLILAGSDADGDAAMFIRTKEVVEYLFKNYDPKAIRVIIIEV